MPQIVGSGSVIAKKYCSFFEIMTGLIKNLVVLFIEQVGKMTFKSILFQNIKVLLKPESLTRSAVFAVGCYKEDFFQCQMKVS